MNTDAVTELPPLRGTMESFAAGYLRAYGDKDLPPESKRWLRFGFLPVQGGQESQQER